MTTGSGSARAAALRLLRWYPRPWKRRYLVEMHALLQQMPVTWRQVANLGATGAREWCSWRALGWPARSAAGRVTAFRAVVFFSCGLGIDTVARFTVWRMQAAGIVVSELVSTMASVVFLAVAIRFFVVMMRRLRNTQRFPKLPEQRRPGQMRGWELALHSVLMFGWLVVRHAEPIPSYLSASMAAIRPYTDILSVLIWANLAFMTSARTWRLFRVQNSVAQRNPGYRPPTLPLT